MGNKFAPKNPFLIFIIRVLPAFICLVSFVPFSGIYAQTSPSTENKKESKSCDCESAFNNLVSKIELDYNGYQLAIKEKRNAEYRQQVRIFKAKARHASNDNCILVLQEFVRFFRDGHMFVQESPTLTDEDVARLTKNAEQTGLTENDIRRYLDVNARRLDPIEGLWYNSDGQRFGIVRNYKPNRRDFVAVMLSEKVERWQPGQVKAEFRKLPDGSYADVFYNGRHYPLHLAVYLRGERGGTAVRRGGLLLHIAPITWGKAYPLKPENQNLIDPANPRRPTIRALDGSTIVISVPSHSPEHKAILNDLVEKFRDRILKSKNLIIDLRGDEGGSTGTTDILMPFLLTPAKRPERYWVGDQMMILSSPDNIVYFKSMESQGWVPKHLLERMQANPGKIVRYSDPSPQTDSTAETEDKGMPFPQNVAILMDSAVVSAGEAFITQVMRNKKVTLFGEVTGGVIDYQSVSIIPLTNCPSLNFNLGYPIFAASGRLPKGGVNATGILPDVRIGRNVKDPIRFIMEYYKKRKPNL